MLVTRRMMSPKYLVELLLGEPDIVLRLVSGARLIAELVPRLRENLSTGNHLHFSLLHSLTTLVYFGLFVNKQTNNRMITENTHSLSPWAESQVTFHSLR